jgi:hypothetical protein
VEPVYSCPVLPKSSPPRSKLKLLKTALRSLACYRPGDGIKSQRKVALARAVSLDNAREIYCNIYRGKERTTMPTSSWYPIPLRTLSPPPIQTCPKITEPKKNAKAQYRTTWPDNSTTRENLHLSQTRYSDHPSEGLGSSVLYDDTSSSAKTSLDYILGPEDFEDIYGDPNIIR